MYSFSRAKCNVSIGLEQSQNLKYNLKNVEFNTLLGGIMIVLTYNWKKWQLYIFKKLKTDIKHTTYIKSIHVYFIMPGFELQKKKERKKTV